ncbi:MAG TPA: glycoside hydrolase family 38 C-terminal domain-containing protein [Terriglobia bacterium]|nr:glycoside hydrolase family 38 C-terminal domain-containing protein [Terriglobia bacterium]
MPSRQIRRVVIRMLVSVCVCFVMQAGGSSALGQAAPGAGKEAAAQKDVLWIIPHTHWEGAVFKTREEYLEMGLGNISAALHLLGEHPEYRFVLDQVAYVRPYLERYPEDAATFRKFVKEGRLQLVGGTDIMPDVNMPSGESFVRQILYGKGYYRDQLGVDVTVGWNLDTFGHNAQMPQILKLAGYNSYWFFRGVSSLDTPSEFLWQGIDGTQIPAFWLPWGYGIFYDSPSNAAEFERFARERFGALTPFSRGHGRVALNGADVSEPEGQLPGMVRQFNQKGDEPFTLRFGVPTDFEAAVEKRGDRQVVGGELNPIFQGIYSSRIELKQWMRKMEGLLSSAEKLGALARWLGGSLDPDELMRAWEPVLFNVTHDLASGVMVDKVYDDVLRGYNFSQRSADEIVRTCTEQIASKIDTHGEGFPIVVFNTLGWPRTDVAETDVELAEGGFVDLSLVDSEGKPVPVQLSEESRYGDGGIKHAQLTFVAREVPALGYAVYHVVPQTASRAPKAEMAAPRLWGTASAAQQDRGSIENEFYRATFNIWTGEMTSLVDKATGWEALRASGNVVAQEQDGGDLWQLYGTLNGGRNIAMTRPILLPDRTRSKFSNEWVGGSGETTAGPVFSQYRVSHPFGKGNFSTRVRLYAGVRRVDIETQILNNDSYVRYRALFPTTIKDGKRTDEIQFGAIERPQGQEFPAQNWIDYGDGAHGLALLNCAMPGNNVAEGTLMLSLLRSAAITAYGFGYEPGVGSDSGLELGRTLTLQYALVPHAGDWREAGVTRAGWEINNPLIVRKVTIHAGSLPSRWGWLEVSAPNVNVSALKPARDGSVILRVYEAAGRPTAGVRIKMHADITSVQEANLMEDAGRELRTEQNAFQFDLHPYEIKTFKVRLRPAETRP